MKLSPVSAKSQQKSICPKDVLCYHLDQKTPPDAIAVNFSGVLEPGIPQALDRICMVVTREFDPRYHGVSQSDGFLQVGPRTNRYKWSYL